MINIQKTADELVKIINNSGLVSAETSVAILKGVNYQEKVTTDDGEIDNPVTPEQHLAQRIAENYIKKATVRGFSLINKENLNKMGL